MRIGGTAEVSIVVHRRITYEIITAGGITPDMTQVEIVAHFVRSSSAKVEGRHSRACIAEITIADHNTICSGRPAGKLCVTQHFLAAVIDKVHHPDIQYGIRCGGIYTAQGTLLHVLCSGRPACFSGRFTYHVFQYEVNAYIRLYTGEQGRNAAEFTVEGIVVSFKNIDLGLDLCQGYVLGGGP